LSQDYERFFVMSENHKQGSRLRDRLRAPIIAATALLAFGVAAKGCAADGSRWRRNTASTEAAAVKGQYRDLQGASRFTKLGDGGEAVYIFKPKGAASASAPVVFFFHGLAAPDPYSYGGWIDHLVRRGAIVVYPVSEDSKFDSADKIRRNAVIGVRRAADELSREGVDLSRVAFVGHSVGGGLSVQLAADARALGLPVPRAIMSVQPGGSKNPTRPDDMARLPSSTLLLVVEGDADQFEESREGKMIVENATGIPGENRVYVLLRSSPGAPADHYTPLSPDQRYRMTGAKRKGGRKLVMKAFGVREGEIDSYDDRGYWRLLDNLLQAASSGGTVSQAVDAVGASQLDEAPNGAKVRPRLKQLRVQ